MRKLSNLAKAKNNGPQSADCGPVQLVKKVHKLQFITLARQRPSLPCYVGEVGRRKAGRKGYAVGRYEFAQTSGEFVTAYCTPQRLAKSRPAGAP